MNQTSDFFAAASAAPRVTAHARARMQQRGIRFGVLEALLDFGSGRWLHGQGCGMVFFDKKAKRRLAKARPGVARETGRLVRTYAIVGSDGLVVTVGHRYRRVGRD